MGQESSALVRRILRNGWLNGPLGTLFYRWGWRRGFLPAPFTNGELFARPDDVDEAWLAMLGVGRGIKGSQDPLSGAVVTSPGSGDTIYHYYQLESLALPVLTLFGERASGISRNGRAEQPEQKAATTYAERLLLADSRFAARPQCSALESAQESGRAVIYWLEGVIDRCHTTNIGRS